MEIGLGIRYYYDYTVGDMHEGGTASFRRRLLRLHAVYPNARIPKTAPSAPVGQCKSGMVPTPQSSLNGKTANLN